jgi:DNA modification methylase
MSKKRAQAHKTGVAPPKIMGKEAIWPLSKLKPYAKNARVHPEGQIQAIMRSFQQFGFMNPILVNLAKGTIIAGHGRFEAAERLGMEKIRVITFDHLSEQEERAYRIADNQLPTGSDWDQELLAAELADLDRLNVSFDGLGFSPEDYARLLAPAMSADQQNAADIEEVPEPPAAPASRVGDLWVLGDHRLLVGDSLVPSNVTRLLAGEQADLVFTDPPYNVAFKGRITKMEIAGDDVSDSEFVAFLRRTFRAYRGAMKANASIYVCHPHEFQRQFQNAMEMSGFVVRAQLIWAKNVFGGGFSRYRYQHEPIFYGHIDEQKDRWFGGRDQSTLWEFPKPAANRLHPTAKPVELVERAIENSSVAGDVFLDLFGGSGSGLIACERTLRRARLSELDPKYADGIVGRWQSLSGQLATLEGRARRLKMWPQNGARRLKNEGFVGRGAAAGGRRPILYLPPDGDALAARLPAHTYTCVGGSLRRRGLLYRWFVAGGDSGIVTHKHLVGLAYKHLRRTSCVVFTEFSTAAGEIPDAIGWRFGFSTLIECKISRSDFLRDKDKCSRRTPSAMGYRRYYLCPWGLLKPEDLPPGWGLLWAKGSRVYVQLKAGAFEEPACNLRSEIAYLTSMLRRAQVRLGQRDLNEWLRMEFMHERSRGVLPAFGGLPQANALDQLAESGFSSKESSGVEPDNGR